jgi:hypothetical protein
MLFNVSRRRSSYSVVRRLLAWRGTPAVPAIPLYTVDGDANGGGDGGSPHGVGNVVFGVWLPTYERAR